MMFPSQRGNNFCVEREKRKTRPQPPQVGGKRCHNHKGVKLHPAQLPPKEQESTTAVRLCIIKREGETEEQDKKAGKVSPYYTHHHPLGAAASRGQCQSMDAPLQKQSGWPCLPSHAAVPALSENCESNRIFPVLHL